METGAEGGDSVALRIAARIPEVVTRIRRSLKPKRVVLFSQELETVAAQLSGAELGCPLVLDGAKPFSLGERDSGGPQNRLRDALLASGTPVR